VTENGEFTQPLAYPPAGQGRKRGKWRAVNKGQATLTEDCGPDILHLGQGTGEGIPADEVYAKFLG
jgi:hypothetical protein